MRIGTQRIQRHYALQQHGAITAGSICALIADQLGVDAARVTDQSHLMKDLGLDWLQRVELVIFVEESAGIELLDDDVDQIEFVGDLVRSVTIAEQDRGDRLAGRSDGGLHH
jgi:acyl carrier protein